VGEDGSSWVLDTIVVLFDLIKETWRTEDKPPFEKCRVR
jgi:hypothetical protein